ncbi:MAG: type II toxin-antitoxin system Phd/YefM family antitoxin [Spirochaetes bacterium]|nr:type II toxin-antitoxin system Phd/YefM family antitoxin [Spirochaetota bacterium]
MLFFNIHDAKSSLSSIVADIETQHETVTLCRNGKPVAQIVPIEPLGSALKRSPKLGKIKFHYDPVEPLTADEWPELA